MSFEVHVNHEERLLYVVGLGNLTKQDMDNYYPCLKGTDGVGFCHKALVNLSDPNVSVKHIPISSIKSMGLLFKNAPILPHGAKMAMVVHSSLAYGFVRLFMGNRGEAVEIRPFKRLDAALAWLNISESAIPKG